MNNGKGYTIEDNEVKTIQEFLEKVIHCSIHVFGNKIGLRVSDISIFEQVEDNNGI